jgi:two-component system, chemotaxis family, chemotaxis protein CheY
MKILIVDDSRAMRKIVSKSLRRAGYGHHDIEEAEDGAVALDAVLRSPPDLVLSDWNMPRLNGLELLQALRQHEIDVPFGFITSEGSPDMRQLAIQNGAAFVITKPFTDLTIEMALEPFIPRA